MPFCAFPRGFISGLMAVAHLNLNRILSGLLAALYIIGASVHAGAEDACKAPVGVVFPLVCIWFADAMGGYIVPTGQGVITSPTSVVFVCIGGLNRAILATRILRLCPDRS
jgi:hypothetical protein